ncbi:MAG: hypothetical protein HXO83_02025 [Selenomonas sp.]|nr:hypothetical protein [Selenomonas sp.]
MIDQKFTEDLSAWLSTPRDERDVVAGAELLMRITGNRQFYATAIVRPHVVHDHVEYELKKHLAIRQEGHNVETLRNLERELLAECAEEFGEEATAEPVEEQAGAEEADAYAVPREGPVVSSPKRGRRADHDALPAEIQALYDDNATRYEQMRKVYQQLLTMADAEPCDRKEHIFQLDKLVKAWAAAWEAYDRYDATAVADAAEDEASEEDEAEEAEETDEASPFPDDPTTFANKIAAAKRYLQKHRKKLRELEEAGAAPEELRAEEEKIAAKQAELEGLTTLPQKNEAQ